MTMTAAITGIADSPLGTQTRSTTQICVDVASVTHEGEPKWMCFTHDKLPAQLAEVSR